MKQKKEILEITERMFETLKDMKPFDADRKIATCIVELRNLIEEPVIIKRGAKIHEDYKDYRGGGGATHIEWTMEENKEEVFS